MPPLLSLFRNEWICETCGRRWPLDEEKPGCLKCRKEEAKK